MVKTVFFEVQDWEKASLQSNFPGAVLTTDKLDVQTFGSYADTVVASCFIYSQINKEVIDKMPNLKFVATRSTGMDHIDVEYCKSRNIEIVNVPEYGSNTVAEHSFALILSLTRKIYQSVNQAKTLNFEHDKIRGIDLCDKTIGIIGLGKIGMQMLRISIGFGMKILVSTRSQKKELADKYMFKYVDLETLLKESDIVSLHVPLSKETHHLINKENILKFKKGSYLINTARGGLIDTEAIILGLEKDILAGCGLDVLEEEDELVEEADVLTSDFKQRVDLETLVYNHMLINHPRVLITPHNAFNSQEALARILGTTIQNVKQFLSSNSS